MFPMLLEIHGSDDAVPVDARVGANSRSNVTTSSSSTCRKSS